MRLFSKVRRYREWLLNWLPSRIREYNCNLEDIQIIISTNRKDDLFRTVRSRNLNSMEQGSLLVWKKLASQSKLALDIGAYSGLYSISASLSGSKVIAFEPNEFIRTFLYKNISLNQCSNILVRHVALSSRHATEQILAPKLKYKINPRTTGSGVQLESAASNRDLTNWTTIGEVPTRTLDEVLTEREMLDTGIAKIDVEGAELDVLLGAVNFLTVTRSFLLIECFDVWQFSKVSSFLEGFGYSHLSTFGGNYLFGKTQLPQDLIVD